MTTNKVETDADVVSSHRPSLMANVGMGHLSRSLSYIDTWVVNNRLKCRFFSILRANARLICIKGSFLGSLDKESIMNRVINVRLPFSPLRPGDAKSFLLGIARRHVPNLR